MKNCATHRVPKAATLAASAASVRAPAPRPIESTQRVARLTASVESARPVNDSTHNGPISAHSERRPRRPHTHRRVGSEEGGGAPAGGGAPGPPGADRVGPTPTGG